MFAPTPRATVRRMRKLRYEDGLTAPETAALVGCCRDTVYRFAPGQPGKVSNEPVRRMFQTSGLSACEVARRMGWDKNDASRVLRTLGLRLSSSGNGHRQYRSLIDAETAGLLAEAMGHERWEATP